ncbi:MAG: peptide deformylase [Candidatus Magasanikbacteria bacterium]
MKLDIIKHPDDILQQKTKEVDAEELQSEEVQTRIDNMIETMHAADGVGLAAPQVGKSKRFTIIGKHALKDKNIDLPTEESGDLPLINPYWNKLNKKKTVDKEGCLSISNTFGTVKRWKKIEVKALDRNGNELSFVAEDYLARVIQHEVDHLEGTLFIEKATDIEEVDPIEQAVKNR